MDKKEGIPKQGHCTRLQVIVKTQKLCSLVMVPFTVISLMSVQEQNDLMARVLKRESNNVCSVLALQKICSH